MEKSAHHLQAQLAVDIQASLRGLHEQPAQQFEKLLGQALHKWHHHVARRLPVAPGHAGKRAVRTLLRYLLVRLRPPVHYGAHGRAVPLAERPHVGPA